MRTTDLDARVAALMEIIGYDLSAKELEQAIRAELKPALHEPVSDQETIDAIRAHHLKVTTESMIDMRAVLESFLQGRAKPTPVMYNPTVIDAFSLEQKTNNIPIKVKEAKPAQEEITDAERFQYLCLDITDSAERAVRNALLDRLCVMSYSSACIDIDAAIRASKGEKT